MNNPESTPSSTIIPLVLRRRFAAPVHVVYAAWTQPERMKRWFHPGSEWTNPSVEVDLCVGGRYRVAFYNPDNGETLAVAGVFQEIMENQRLVYSWTWEPPKEDAGIETRVTVEFSDAVGETLIHLTHEQFTSDTMRREHGEGWAGAFTCLDTSLGIDPSPIE